MGRKKKNRGAKFAEGERSERCQRQIQRGERVAGVKISSARRKAAWKFWAPQQEGVRTNRPVRLMGAVDV